MKTVSMLSSQKSAYLNFYLAAVSLLVFLTTLWGVYTHFSPVPFWDMWDGYLRFYLQILDHDHSAWLQQHNEHRIFMSRILFWIDIRFFRGTGAFLLCVNLLIQLGTACVFSSIISKRMKSDPYKYAIHFFVICLLFSWVQNNNLTWAFQSQFLFVYMFSLLAFWNLGQYSTEKKIFYLACSLLSACCAAFSMANGLLVFPLLFVQALFLRISKRSILAIVVVALGIFAVYFNNYQKPSGHASSVDSLLQHPFLVIQFMFTFLGSPFKSALNNIHCVTAAGVLLMAGAGSYLYFIIKKRNLDSVNLTLFTFLLFIFGTALATATGRINFGPQAAMESRYTTPALMGWITLIIIGFVNQSTVHKYFFQAMKGALICIPLLLLPPQLKAFEDFSGTAFTRKLAVFGLARNHYDESYARQVYPFKDVLVDTVDQSLDQRLSIFGTDWYKYDHETLSPDSISEKPCMGHMESVRPFQSGSTIAYRVKGWVWDPETKSVPEYIVLTDSSHQVVGLGISGEPRPDVTAAIEGHPTNTGWRAYVDKSSIKGPIYAFALTDSGILPVPGQPIELAENTLIAGISDWDGKPPSKFKILNSEWTEGKLPPHVKEDDPNQVLTSGSQGDEFEGKVEIEFEPDHEPINITYMTGPDSTAQKIEVFDSDGKLLTQFEIPESTHRWSNIRFDLNAQEKVQAVLSDQGKSWGQWSVLLIP
jgi:hypothetical protein